jgi:hypothetical protein
VPKFLKAAGHLDAADIFISIRERIWTLMPDNSLAMSEPERIDLLVRAFKAAWDHYFRPGRQSELLECITRPALAKFLVSKAREGIDDEPSLAAAGLEFLFSLEDVQEDEETGDGGLPSWSLHLENAAARFVRVKHVRLVPLFYTEFTPASHDVPARHATTP